MSLIQNKLKLTKYTVFVKMWSFWFVLMERNFPWTFGFWDRYYIQAYMIFQEVNEEIPLVVMELITVVINGFHYVENLFKFKIILLITNKFAMLKRFLITKCISVFWVEK